MDIDAHLAKIETLMRSRARMDPAADFELWFWAGMLAGTHAYNAALHHAGLTRPERAFAMQPGVYLVAQPADAATPELREPGDVLHVGRPAIGGVHPADIRRMATCMEQIEHHRDACVREGQTVTPDIVSGCALALDECLLLLRRRLKEDSHASA